LKQPTELYWTGESTVTRAEFESKQRVIEHARHLLRKDLSEHNYDHWQAKPFHKKLQKLDEMERKLENAYRMQAANAIQRRIHSRFAGLQEMHYEIGARVEFRKYMKRCNGRAK
jgi:predicted mannosyl-3-phosphoglycerate phosphatase (HAD superfamily)